MTTKLFKNHYVLFVSYIRIDTNETSGNKIGCKSLKIGDERSPRTFELRTNIPAPEVIGPMEAPGVGKSEQCSFVGASVALQCKASINSGRWLLERRSCETDRSHGKSRGAGDWGIRDPKPGLAWPERVREWGFHAGIPGGCRRARQQPSPRSTTKMGYSQGKARPLSPPPPTFYFYLKFCSKHTIF